MKYLRLENGKHTKVSDDDFEWLRQWKWRALKSGKSHYVTRSYYEDDVLKTVYMHRLIMGLGKGDKRQVDHINHDPLDNRLENLEIVSRRENLKRRRLDAKGYTWSKTNKKWIVQMYLGSFDTEEEARECYAIAKKALETAEM